MLPRWFRVAVLLEIVGLIALVLLGVRLVQSGDSGPIGDIAHWSAPAHQPNPTPRSTGSTDLLVPRLPAVSAPLIARSLLLPSDLWSRLSRDTGAAAVGEYSLLLQLEAAIRSQIESLIAAEQLR